MLLQRHSPHQAGDRSGVGEDADKAKASFDLLVDSLEQVSAPDLLSMGLWEVTDPQHDLLGLVHEPGGLGEVLRL